MIVIIIPTTPALIPAPTAHELSHIERGGGQPPASFFQCVRGPPPRPCVPSAPNRCHSCSF
jgi:hypothetical protein